VLSALLIRIFVRPIQALSDSVRAIGEGSMPARIGDSGNEEIDEIARAFNEVTAKFRGRAEQPRGAGASAEGMQVAQEIQQSLLPRRVPELEGYEIGHLYRARRRLAATTTTSSTSTTAPWAWWWRMSRARACRGRWS